MPNLFGRLAEAWVDNVTNLFDYIMDMAGIWDSTGRRLTDRTSKQGLFDGHGQIRGRYDPFKETRVTVSRPGRLAWGRVWASEPVPAQRQWLGGGGPYASAIPGAIRLV